MELKEILALTDKSQFVQEMKKGRDRDLPNIDLILKEWDPNLHDIVTDKNRYPDRTIKDKDGIYLRTEYVNRIAIPFQKLIVKRTASFLFGNPLKVKSSDEKNPVAAAVRGILKCAKSKSLDRKVARTLFAATEVAEYWYPVEKKHKKYGFESEYELRCTVFDPLKGDVLYPYFDNYGTMLAFSREYKVKESGKDVTYFESLTPEKYYRLKMDGQWQDALNEDFELDVKKITIVYGRLEEVTPIWSDVQFSIGRLERLLSKFGNVNDKHGSPKIAVTGELLGISAGDDEGTILQMDEGGSAEYISWNHAPESVKMEIEMHLSIIYTMCRIANTSFDNLKGIGPLSGIALRLMFSDTDALMGDLMEIFDEYMERRLNILKAFIGKMNPSWLSQSEELDFEVEQVPMFLSDEKETIDNLATAVSAKIISQKTAVSKNPLVDDADEEVKILVKEADDASKLENLPTELDNLQNEDE